MRKILKVAVVIALVAAVLYMGSVMSDRRTLNENIIRLHVVADSDSAKDQAVKLKVRDAVIAALENSISNESGKEEVQKLLEEKLSQLQEIANEVLREEGMTQRATVSLTKEEFPTRQYDTFSLPAGVYDSLRVTIGSGGGMNWWCVVFPSLCVPAASEGVADTAVSAGFSDDLSNTLTGETGYEVRFFLLDCLGWVENFFHQS